MKPGQTARSDRGDRHALTSPSLCTGLPQAPVSMPSSDSGTAGTGQQLSLPMKAATDCSATMVFVLAMSLCDELSRVLAPVLNLSPQGTGMALIVLILIAMGQLCARLGGALFNPANNAMLYAMGKGDLLEHAVRAVGQCMGAVVGVALAQTVLPYPWQKGFANLAVGLRPEADIFEGATCEFVLGLLLAFLVSYSADCRSKFWKQWLPLMATVLAVRAGAPYSGPSLNPAVTFGWEFMYQQQSRAEHLAVFWAAPLAAGLMGGWCYLGMREFTARRQRQQQQQQGEKDKDE